VLPTHLITEKLPPTAPGAERGETPGQKKQRKPVPKKKGPTIHRGRVPTWLHWGGLSGGLTLQRSRTHLPKNEEKNGGETDCGVERQVLVGKTKTKQAGTGLYGRGP